MISKKIKNSLLTLKMLKQIGKLESVIIFHDRYVDEVALAHHEDYMDMRKRYVVEQGWLELDEEDTDEDYYDTSDDTVTVLVVTNGEKPKIVCGMRLTSIEPGRVNESLSFTMLSGAIQGNIDKNETLLTHAEEELPHWDITRLITNPAFKDNRSLMNAALFKMFAAAMAVVHEIDKNNYPHETSWFFTTTPEIIQFIGKRKIEHEIVASGRIGDKDKHESYFVVMKPFKSLNQLNKSNKLLAAAVRRIIKNITV